MPVCFEMCRPLQTGCLFPFSISVAVIDLQLCVSQPDLPLQWTDTKRECKQNLNEMEGVSFSNRHVNLNIC